MKNGFSSENAIQKHLFLGAKLYFVGIGGVSMSGLAHIAASRGYTVSGCDRDTGSDAVKRLRLDNIPVDAESDADPRHATLVIYTAAVRATTPALQIAVTHNIPCVSRADFLAAMMAPYPTRIAISGMHGKSTTVGMLTRILVSAELDPTVSAGAPLFPGGDTWCIGKGDIFLCEACEYRDSFLSLSPTLSVITNIELDHPDYFSDMSAVERSFATFISQSDNTIVGGDCEALHALAPQSCIRFGLGENCHIRGKEEPHGVKIWHQGSYLGFIPLLVHGTYNCKNALAAVAVALSLGIDFATIKKALSEFTGVGRRMEYVGNMPVGGGTCPIFLDYAHHPTELISVISSAKRVGKRILAVFQPHTFTRTQALWGDFAAALRLPDYTVLVDIYAARENAIDGITSSCLAAAAGVDYAQDLTTAARCLSFHAHPNDTILILGAGDIDRIAPFLVNARKQI